MTAGRPIGRDTPSASRSAAASSTAASRGLAGHAHPHGPAFGEHLLDPRGGVVLRPRADLRLCHVAHADQQVVHVVGVARATPLRQPLQLQLQLIERGRVQQVAELLLTEELAQQVPVQRERGGTSLRERRVALVHIDGHPSEEQRLCERRRVLGVHGHEPRPARAKVGHDLAERRHVEHVSQAFTSGLQEHRERRVFRRGDQQVGRTLALLPERRSLAGTAAGEQQRACGRLAERAREQRRARQDADDLLLDLVRIEQQIVERDPVLGLGKPDHDAVVAPEHLCAGSHAFGQPRLDRQAPRGVHALAERREDAESPVAELVPEAFDDDRVVVGDGAGRLALVVNVLDQVLRGEFVEADVIAEPRERLGPGCVASSRVNAPNARPSSSGRPGLSPFQNGILPGSPGAGTTTTRSRVMSSIRHELAPRTNTSPRRLSYTISSSSSPTRVPSGRNTPKSPRSGIVPAFVMASLPGTLPRADDAGLPVPHEPRPQLGEVVARVPAGQQVEHRVEHVVGQLGEVRDAADDCAQLVDVPLVDRAHRHELLGEHVERVARIVRLLDQAGTHPLRHDRRLQQITTELREDLPAAGFADLMPRAADALQPARDRPRRLHLDHQVDGPHVDAELE